MLFPRSSATCSGSDVLQIPLMSVVFLLAFPVESRISRWEPVASMNELCCEAKAVYF